MSTVAGGEIAVTRYSYCPECTEEFDFHRFVCPECGCQTRQRVEPEEYEDGEKS